MSFWSKLGKGALFAAPFAAAPFTGGMSLLPRLGIQAGIGAASGGVAGGKKGALLGAGLGAGLGSMPGGSSFGNGTLAGLTEPLAGYPNAGGRSLSSMVTSGVNKKSLLGSLFGNKGLDPTSLLFAGLAALQPYDATLQSYKGTGADPVKTLTDTLEAIKAQRGELQGQGPVRLRSAIVQHSPEPVSIPGLPFQIGGGLGHDPALDNPALLEGQYRKKASNG